MTFMFVNKRLTYNKNVIVMSCGNEGNIIEFSSLDCNIKSMLSVAVEARKKSYSPYSNFPVGACLLCDDGSMYAGCNVENALFGITLCAERTAVVKAVSDGRKMFKAIAVVAEQEDRFTSPCGSCRQFLAEFGSDIVVYMSKPCLQQVMISNIKELLPLTFSLN